MSIASDLFGTATERLQPKPGTKAAEDPDYIVLQTRLAAWVGLVALLLPVVLSAVGAQCRRTSISAYYHDVWTGDLFVAGLATIALFLFAYKGRHWAENLLATLAGLAALGVALLPTANPGCEFDEDYVGRVTGRWTATGPGGDSFLAVAPTTTAWHLGSAVALFLILAIFCLWVFTRVLPERDCRDGRLTPEKRTRNAIYIACGTTILLALAALGLGWWQDRLPGRSVFWLEAVVLWAFGVAWVVRGRLFGFGLTDEREPARPTS